MIGQTIFAKLDPFFFGNRKIMRAGRNGRDVFLFALCMNAQRGAPGFIPAADLEPWYVARQMGIDQGDAEEGLAAAVTAGLLKIDGERVVIIGWGQDWSRRPQTRAEIQSNYRKRNKKGTTEDSERYQGEVTSYESSNALPIEKRREEKREVTVTDSLSGYAPSQEARTIAETRRLDLVHELAQFRSHAKAKKWSSEDWDASFCKWLRNSRDVDRKPDKGRPRAKAGPHVTRQRTADGATWILTEADGNQREISEEEAAEYGVDAAT